MSDLIDIDVRGDIVVTLDASVELVDERPVLKPKDVGKWLAALGRCLGKPLVVALVWPVRQRSSQQNRYLWGPFYGGLLAGLRGIALDAGEECPFKTKDALHEACKYRFLGTEILTMPGGDTWEVPATTTKLTPMQFQSYWKAIARWAAEKYGLYLPEPNERVEV